MHISSKCSQIDAISLTRVYYIDRKVRQICEEKDDNNTWQGTSEENIVSLWTLCA